MSSSLPCLPLLENATPRYLNFSFCLRVTLFVWKEHWTGSLDNYIISVLAVLIFIPASKHASENQSSACWRLLLFELNNARSSANSRHRALHSPNVQPLFEELSLSIMFTYIMNRRGKRTQPCCSPTLRLIVDLSRHILAILPTACLLRHGHTLF